MTPPDWPPRKAVDAGADAALREALGFPCMDPECECEGGKTCDHCLPRVVCAALRAAWPIMLRSALNGVSAAAITRLRHTSPINVVSGMHLYGKHWREEVWKMLMGEPIMDRHLAPAPAAPPRATEES